MDRRGDRVGKAFIKIKSKCWSVALIFEIQFIKQLEFSRQDEENKKIIIEKWGKMSFHKATI